MLPGKPRLLKTVLSTLTCWLKAFFLLYALPQITFSQTTNISGIINTYHSVTEVIPSLAAVRVDDVTGLAYGNLVVLVQMKGAAINTANNSSFGDTTSLNNAGNYEIATICDVGGDTVYFFHEILNSYTVADKVQLVKFGEYYSANVVDTLKASAWNGSTGKGAVLAIRVEEDLTLNAPLFADASGFAGGSYLLHSGTCSNFFQATGYVYDGDNTNSNTSGAYKGEGVWTSTSTLDGGRGAPANGGGGGNNHNNGGGGGANLATGGSGGGNFSTTGCQGNFRGLAGKALSSWGGTKIFCGGGGGAGHSNNNTATSGGGKGGGIIIVIAKNIYGNGYKISANGQTGGTNISDGASGGGAGGTIIMHVINSYSGSLTIEAKGGNGGNADNDLILNRCYGAGGGGSGGVIYFNGSLPAVTTSVNGGTAGADIDINGCGTPVPAENGNAGSVIVSYSYRTSTTASNDCPGALPVKLISFYASLTVDKKVKIEWTVANPEEAISFTVEKRKTAGGWYGMATQEAEAGKNQYEVPDFNPLTGDNIYRLLIKAKDNSGIYSPQRKVYLNSNDRFTVYPNPARNKIFILGKINSPVPVKLTDISGAEIKAKIINSSSAVTELSLPSLPPGIYLLKIGNEVKKLLIH
jgi:hypothetical protein